MRPFHHLALALALCGLALPGCAADEEPTDAADEAEGAGGDADGSGFDVGSESAEETGTTTDSAEQAFTVDGCSFYAQLSVAAGSGGRGEALAKGYVKCSPAKYVYIGVCLDRYESSRWVAKDCTGRARVNAASWGYGSAYGLGHGKYRARIRVEGYGTAVSSAKRI